MTDWTSLDRAQDDAAAADIEAFALERAHADVVLTRHAYENALRHRGKLARNLRDEGVTIYAIAKRLGVTQPAVRQMLGL